MGSNLGGDKRFFLAKLLLKCKFVNFIVLLLGKRIPIFQKSFKTRQFFVVLVTSLPIGNDVMGSIPVTLSSFYSKLVGFSKLIGC